MSWEELVASALLGTARRPPALPETAPGPGLGSVLAAIDRADPEGAVLAAGAALGLYRQAGWRPEIDTGPLPPVSPPETGPVCSEAAASRLDAMLAGRFRHVLGEWLALAAAAGCLVPPDRLPPLLEAASANPEVRATTLAVAGERGRWLAGLNPRWAWAAGGDGGNESDTWATGPAPARRLLLARLRATDPAAARTLVMSTWGTETAEDRAAFLAAFATGLSLDDEGFLEAALDDRRKEVRHAAAGLLWRLPGSRLATRMAERARPLVRIAGGRRRRVEADFPVEVDGAMVRDGVVTRPPAGQGPRAWWLHQLVAATPLPVWPEALGQPPARLVELAGVGETGPLVRRAWATAAARQGSEEWALALLEVDDLHEPALLGAVPPPRAQEVATDRVARVGLTPAVLDLLHQCPPPWGPALSRTVLERLGPAVEAPARPGADALALRGWLGDLGARLDPSLAPEAVTALAEHGGWWSDVVGWFLDLLTFRADMREELPS